MYLSSKASRARQREAENAQRNRMEMAKALAEGQITKRDLFRAGLLTATGMLALKNGLSPYASSAYAAVPTGTPASPLGTATKFSQAMPRTVLQTPYNVTPSNPGDLFASEARFPHPNELPARRLSYHQEFTDSLGTARLNPVTFAGPCEGRPQTEMFAHQRWQELFPKKGYLLSLGQIRPGVRFHPGMIADQNANAVWSFGSRPIGRGGSPADAGGIRTGGPTPPLLKLRYGEPVVTRIYNDLPVSRAANGGFGRNEISTHFHNAHNGAESDGACNAYHFPGTFYDYHWGTTLARRDLPSVWLTSDPNYLRKASGPDDGDGLVQVAGDFRELQGTLWFHDHRFFFTAENVHKGNFAVCNMYSGPDRGRDNLNDGICLKLPSGNRLPWGNTDFDVNLAVSNPAMSPDGQMFFDIFDTLGFLGDMLLVNGAYYPYMEVLPRRYRFRILNASMARFIKLALAVHQSSRFATGTTVPFYFIANDGNFVVSPLKLTALDEQGVAERYDIVIDFSVFAKNDKIRLVNLLQQTGGQKPDGAVTVAQAIAGVAGDPCVGPILEFRVVDSLQSVDDPTKTYTLADADPSENLGSPDWVLKRKKLTEQIPIVAPVRTRTVIFNKSGNGDSRDPATGQCIPECGDITSFPWNVSVDGQPAHSLNANRISALIPKPGEVEHWTLINGGSGWDHPIHLHFEEGITMNRGTAAIPSTELLVRKDVWRLRPAGQVKFQVRFGEFGGAYVNHCHNTTHEDFAMLMRYQLLSPPPFLDPAGTIPNPDFRGQPQYVPTRTPLPSENGVTWKDPELPA